MIKAPSINDDFEMLKRVWNGAEIGAKGAQCDREPG